MTRTEKYVYNDDEDLQDLILRLNEYADRHPEFNAKFIDSIEFQLNEKGKITRAQLNALQDVYDKIIHD